MTVHIRGAVEGDESAVVMLWRSCGLVVGNSDPVRDFRAARQTHFRHPGCFRRGRGADRQHRDGL